DWAAERIKSFSLSKAIFYAFFGRWFKKNAPRTISDTFYYPIQGSGTLWEKAALNFNRSKDSSLLLHEEVVSIEHDGKKITAICTKKTNHQKATVVQKLKTYPTDYVLSTMPLQKLILIMDPPPSQIIINAAKNLAYRGLITINLIINKQNICLDHWLYIHEKSVLMGRIGNMNNFSLKMVDHQNHTALSLEYFEYVDQGIWNKSDKQLIQLGSQELEKIGLIKKEDVIDGMIMRIPEAYPVYDENYQENLSIVLNYISQFSNIQLMGRNGLHQYNNMDVAMLSAWQATNKIIEQEKQETKIPKKKSGHVTTCTP
ncbi:MAG: FAD-dependent oxidoreductase, partial [bacterium]